VISSVKTIKVLSFVFVSLLGVASTQAGTAHAGHTTVHTGGRGNNHGSYHGGHGYYAQGGQSGRQSGRYWHGGYYHGRYYSGGYYPYDSPFFLGLPIPFTYMVPDFN